MMLQIFQYNSCYCLSLLKRWISPISANFNTTLVIVYLHNATDKIIFEQFQYNSCYCLSLTSETFRMNRHLYFNTTLVIVYREVYTGISITGIISIQLLLLFIIHLKGIDIELTAISIQLLLLFIGQDPFGGEEIDIFQYNSCYCLSINADTSSYVYENFNTTLVIVYPLCRKMFMSK